MMVTSCDEATASGGSVLPVLTNLKNKAVPSDERVGLYSSLAEEFQKDDISSLLRDLGQQGSQLVVHFCRDIQSDQRELSQVSLRILGLCLHYEQVAKSFTDNDSSALLIGLCSTILKTDDKSTCTRALWCLSRQQLPGSVIQKELHNVLCALEHVLQKNKFQSMTSEYEAVNLLLRLLDQLPNAMICHTTRWAPLLFPLLVHSAHKIRERAHQAVEPAMPSLRKHQEELAPSLVNSLKSTMLVDMAELFSNKHERYVLKIWKLCVNLLGKALHRGGSLINLMLRIVEQGFKHGFPEVKRDAFDAWKVLIDNFTLDLDVLSNAKRLKLLMQPFLATSTKQESVALAKFDAWWHLCTALGPRLSPNFEMVVVPLLQFSLGIAKTSGYNGASTPSNSHRHQMQSMRSGGLKALAMSSPATTPRMNLSSPFRSPDPYDSLLVRGIIVLGQMLANQDVSVDWEKLQGKISDAPPVLTVPVLSKVAMVFIKIVSNLIPAVCETIQQHGKLMEDDLCIEMFSALTQHVTNALENSKKQDSAEMFGAFLCHLQMLVNEVDMESTTILKFMSSLKSLPSKVLSSSAYLSGSVGCVLHGTPTLFLLELLLGPKLVKSSSEERYFILLEYLIECGVSNQSSVLGFTNSYLALLDKVSADVTNKETLWRMWSCLSSPLLEHILQTNEVNQGDSFEHDFSALIACLLFPVQNILPFEFPVQTTKALLKTWTDLYQAFSRCAAMVTTAEDNQCCQDLCVKICSFVVADTEFRMTLPFIEGLFHLCKVMVDSVDFSSYSSQNSGLQSPNLTAKWNKKRHKPLKNLSSLVKLLSHAMFAFHKHRSDQTVTFLGKASQAYLSSWTTIITNCCHTVTTLFSHISKTSLLQQLIGKLGKPLSGFYGNNNGFPPTDVYRTNLLPKLDKLWQEVLMSIQVRYPGPYDSDSLEVFEPMLEATLTSSHRSIRNHTLLFWSATFAKATTLKYSDRLKHCLQSLKEKNDVTLPDWTDVDVIVDEDTSSLVSEGRSQSLLLPSSMSPSPRKIHGSFLQRPAEARQLFASSSPFKSPSKLTSQAVNKQSPAKPKILARRKLDIEEESTQDFVFIAPSPKKKQILTEHQKEMRRSKRVIPALYNDLEQSQDTETFSELTSTESQLPERASVSTPPDVTTETTSLTEAFAALKRAEEASQAEKELNLGNLSSNSIEVVGSKKVKFADDFQKEDTSALDKNTDDFVAKMNERIKSLKNTLKSKQKDSPPVEMSVMVIGESQPVETGEIKEPEKTESSQRGEIESKDSRTVDQGMRSTPSIGDGNGENTTVIPETQIELTTAPATDEPQEEIGEPLPLESQTGLDSKEKLTTEKPLESSPKTPPSSNSFPFEVSDGLDVSDITCCNNEISPHIKISTPLVKVHKLDLSKLETITKKEADIRMAGQSTPTVTESPTGSQIPQETPRFRRHKSDEIHTRSLSLGRRVRKWHSFEDAGSSSPSTEAFSPVDIDMKALTAETLPLDTASDKADLDGIHPLDCSFDDFEEPEDTPIEKKTEELKSTSKQTGLCKSDTPLRRGKRQRKAKNFCDFVTPVKLLSMIHQNIEQNGENLEDLEEIENSDIFESEHITKEKGNEMTLRENNEEDANGTQTDKENMAEEEGRDVQKDESRTEHLWEPTAELFSIGVAKGGIVAESIAPDKQDNVNSRKRSGDTDRDQVHGKDSYEEMKEKDASKEALDEGKGILEAESDQDISDDAPLAVLKSARKKLQRRGRKRKKTSTEVINLCDTQSQEPEEKCQGQDLGDPQIRGCAIREEGPSDEREEMKEPSPVESSEVTLDCSTSNTTGQEEAEEVTERSGGEKMEDLIENVDEKYLDDPETVRGVKEDEVTSISKEESLPSSPDVNSDEEIGAIEKEDAAKQSFDSEDEMPLTHLRENSIVNEEEEEPENAEAHTDSKGDNSQKECQESREALISSPEKRLSKKSSSSRTCTNLNRSVSPKIRRNLSARFSTPKQLSPLSNSFHGFTSRRKSPKRSPKLLRSMGMMGSIYTRLRSRGSYPKRISPKQERALKKKALHKKKRETAINISLDSKLSILESATMESSPSVDNAKSSISEEDCNAAQEGGEEVTMETISAQTDATSSCIATNSAPEIQELCPSQDLFQSDTSSLEDSVTDEEVTKGNSKTDILASTGQNLLTTEKIIEVPRLVSEEGSNAAVVHSNLTPTASKPDDKTLEGGSPPLENIDVTRESLTGFASVPPKAVPTSPVVSVKFAPTLHSSPLASSKPSDSLPDSPEVLGIPRVYSPTASPSNGILKKRDESFSNSPSPTNKNRRVKFSEKISTKEIENCTPIRSSDKRRQGNGDSSRTRTSSKLLPSPLVTTTPSRVVSVHSKYITTPSKDSDAKVAKTTSSSRHSAGRKFRSPSQRHKLHHRVQTETPPTQGNPGSQLDSSLDEDNEPQESIFPQLQDCEAPVEEILPQLTSSMWSRGLGQLVRARNIFTIGQLSALTPSEVQSLPIRSPKVSHLKWVLGQYFQRRQSKNSADNSNPSGTAATVEESRTTSETEDAEPSTSSLKRQREADDTSEECSDPKKLKVVEELEKLSEGLNEELLRSVSPAQLFKAHEHINAMMDTVMNVLKAKYQPT